MAFVARCCFCTKTKPIVCVYERSFVCPQQYGLCGDCARELIGYNNGIGLNGEVMKTFKLVPVEEFTALLLLSRMPVEKRKAVWGCCEICYGVGLECTGGCKHKKHLCCPMKQRGNFVVFDVGYKYPCSVCDRCFDKHIQDRRDKGRAYRIFMLELTDPKKFARGFVYGKTLVDNPDMVNDDKNQY